jgi:uncharacterized damage-inducible protein DinB
VNADYFRALFSYNYDTHQRVWACIDHLSDAQFVEETDYSLRSVRNHMVHLMNVDSRWLARVQEAPPPARLVEADFPTRAAVRAYWDTVEARMRDYISSVDDAALQKVVVFDMPQRGGMKTNHVWEILAHVVNHGTDHRAQVLALLHHFGAPTLEQDFMLYQWGI